MVCCDEMLAAMDREIIVHRQKHLIDDGRILNDVNTEYFIRSTQGSHYNYLGLNYCPFCGRALSLGLWAAEKKK